MKEFESISRKTFVLFKFRRLVGSSVNMHQNSKIRAKKNNLKRKWSL